MRHEIVNQRKIRKLLKESNESEIRKNAMYGEVFKEIISKAAKGA